MVETSRDWSEKLPFTLWAYQTSFRTSTGATPYSLVYGMVAVLLVEIEMRSLRIALKRRFETDWAQARFDQLNLLDERRLRAADHVLIRGLIRDPRGKFRPSWSGPYFIRELSPEGAAWLMDLDGNQFSSRPIDPFLGLIFSSHHHYTSYYRFNMFHLSPHRHYVHIRHHWVPSSWDLLYLLHFIHEGMNFDYWVFELSFSSFLSPYHPSLRYVPCLKTTLRPWDQMSSSTASAWTVVFGLPGSQDSMLSDLRPIIHFDAIQGHISVRMRFTDHEGVACLSLFARCISPLVHMIIHGYEIHARSMFDFILSGYSEEPLLSHSSRFILFGIVMIPRWSCLWCLDFPHHHFSGVHIRSIMRPIGVILGSSRQIGYI
ncbi:hypothetical protein AAG906_016343 [Vitis piasezkii]